MNKVAIVLPTKNRHAFLKRQLEFYKMYNSQHPIYIGDGTDNKIELEKIINTIEKYKSHLNIFFYHNKNEKHVHDTQAKVLKKVKEKYVAQIGDDDFFIPESLSVCADFLSKNKDYSSAQGYLLRFEIDDDSPFGNVKKIYKYTKDRNLADKKASERLYKFVENYWLPEFCVRRTNEVIKIHNELIKVQCPNFGEKIKGYLSVISGKSKYMNHLHLVRQATHRIFNPGYANTYKWITNKNWTQSFFICKELVINSLILSDKVSYQEAENIFEKFFWKELIELTREYKDKYNVPNFSQNNSLTMALYLKKNIKKIINKITTKETENDKRNNSVDINSLISKSEKYSKEVNSLFNIVTNNATKKT